MALATRDTDAHVIVDGKYAFYVARSRKLEVVERSPSQRKYSGPRPAFVRVPRPVAEPRRLVPDVGGILAEEKQIH